MNGISERKCLSTGECNGCKIINSYHEGCDIHSNTPVCDADSTTVTVEDSAVAKLARCVGCKKIGNLLSVLNFIANGSIFMALSSLLHIIC